MAHTARIPEATILALHLATAVAPNLAGHVPMATALPLPASSGVWLVVYKCVVVDRLTCLRTASPGVCHHGVRADGPHPARAGPAAGRHAQHATAQEVPGGRLPAAAGAAAGEAQGQGSRNHVYSARPLRLLSIQLGKMLG